MVKHVAHEAFRNNSGAFHDPAHLGVDAAAQALGGRVGRNGLLSECIKESGGGKPEGARGGDALEAVDAGYGFAHFLRAGGVLGIAEPLEQASFEAASQGPQAFRIFTAVDGRGESRALGQVGEEQFAGAGALLPAGGGEFGVKVEEAQGLVRLAAGQFVEVVADGGDAAGGQLGHLGREYHLFAGQFAEQTVELLGKLGQAVEPDDRQGAMGLVQMGLGKLDPAKAIRGGPGFGERSRGPFEGQVDLAFDPGQRTQVEFMC